MKKMTFGRKALLGGFLAAGSVVAGCGGGGGNTEGGDQDFASGDAVSNADTVGRFEVRLEDETVATGGTTEFVASAFDASGAPVEGIRILCDSESGVAILEPTTGVEMTSARGSISGVIGCENPGSYRFGCRLPGGANKREFVTVRCDGAVPAGFGGFDGAAGGTLGGGAVDPSNGGPGGAAGGDVRATGVSFFTIGDGASATSSIDLEQGSCTVTGASGAAATSDPEPFGDDSVEFTVANDTNERVRLLSMSYTVPGTSLRSKQINFIGETVSVPAGQTSKVRALFTDTAVDGDRGLGTKFPPGSRTSFLDALDPDRDRFVSDGVRNVDFTVTYQGSTSGTRTFTVSQSASFDNFNVCGN